MRKTKNSIFKVILILFAFSVMALPVFASAIDEEKQKKQELENKLTDVEKVIEELEDLKGNVSAYIKELDSKMAEIEKKIQDYETQISQKQGEIDQTNIIIAQKEEELEEQYNSMKLRIKFMYENGNAQLLDMFFGSENFGEMLNKYDYLAEITKYDRNMLENIELSKKEIESYKAKLETEKNEILAIKDASKTEREAVATLVEEKSSEVSSYMAQIGSYEEIEAQLASEIKSSEDTIRRLTLAYNGEEYSGGALLMPLATYNYISTQYGWSAWHASMGYSAFHAGIDFAAPTGTPIRAAASGVVVSSYLSSSAGEFIILYHGNGLYTEYMHCSVRNVSAGDSVTVGDIIGLVGSTGYSSGPHLHFGVVLNQNGYSTNSRVDPNPYLGL